MKLSLTIDETECTIESKEDDLYHIILHFKSMLLSHGYDSEKINGCFESATKIWITKE